MPGKSLFSAASEAGPERGGQQGTGLVRTSNKTNLEQDGDPRKRILLWSLRIIDEGSVSANRGCVDRDRLLETEAAEVMGPASLGTGA